MSYFYFKTYKIKKLLLILAVIPFIANSQYSSYYNVDVNSSSIVNVNKNVNVSGYTTQTIKTIDYGPLQTQMQLEKETG